MNKAVHIPRTLANRLLTLAQGSSESGICGLIASDENKQYWVYPSENNANNTHHTLEQIKEKKQSLFAVFHSHPNSADDLSSTNTPKNALSIIISLGTQGVLEMRGVSNKNNKTEAVDLIIH